MGLKPQLLRQLVTQGKKSLLGYLESYYHAHAKQDCTGRSAREVQNTFLYFKTQDYYEFCFDRE